MSPTPRLDPRVLLAAHALQGILAADRREHGTPREARHVAAEAVEYADAVLALLTPAECPLCRRPGCDGSLAQCVERQR